MPNVIYSIPESQDIYHTNNALEWPKSMSGVIDIFTLENILGMEKAGKGYRL